MACLEPEVEGVSFVAERLDGGVLGPTDAACVVTGSDVGVSGSDSVMLDCVLDGTTAPVAITHGNSVVSLPTRLRELGVAVALTQAGGLGSWLTVRDAATNDLLLGFADGTWPVPYGADGPVSDFFDPLSIELEAGFCAPAPGSCSELGEPGVLRIGSPGGVVDVFPFQGAIAGDLAVHTGRVWWPDWSSPSCEGDTDQWASFMVGAP